MCLRRGGGGVVINTRGSSEDNTYMYDVRVAWVPV